MKGGIGIMSGIRDFSVPEGLVPLARNIDDDAPYAMRHEIVDLIFHIVEENPDALDDNNVYHVVSQCLGIAASGNPYGGPRYAVGRDIARAEWPRVYDVICRLWPVFSRVRAAEAYRVGINRILAAHGVVWDLNEDGNLRRVLPQEAQRQIEAAITELRDPRFAPALELYNAARDAYDDRPRRERDTCSNVFDAMESVAKEVFGMPTATFGAVLAHVRQAGALQGHVIGVLEAVNTLRNRTFGHGMVVAFNLSAAEVDFTYLTCIGGILLFARMPTPAGTP